MKCLGERYAIETVANLMKRKDGKKSDEIREILKMEDGDYQGVPGDDDDMDDKKWKEQNDQNYDTKEKNYRDGSEIQT